MDGITFEEDGLTYTLRVDIAETVCDENGPAFPRLVDGRNATADDLLAAGYVKVPSVEELADAIRDGLWSGMLDYTSAARSVLRSLRALT